MTTIAEFADTMQTLLTTTADDLAKKTSFIQRQRTVTGSGFAQALVFNFMAKPTSTREDVKQTAANAGVVLSTPGLDQRFTSLVKGHDVTATFAELRPKNNTDCIRPHNL